MVDAKRFYHKLNCIKNDDAEIMGNYNDAAAKQLVIKFDICRDEAGTPPSEKKCKEESDIMQWLNRKFLVTLENDAVFRKNKVESEKLSKQSSISWNVLSPQLRTDSYKYV